jgi:branched-chain amino acid transport system substrate-binding protein
MTLMLTAAACGSSTTASGSQTTASTSTAVANAALLGPANRAAGTPVKVGLITDGGACNGCGSGNEATVSRATVAWLNEHLNGLAGHPITLDVCVDNLDPGTAIDCANQMIRDNDVAVVIGSDGVIESSWTILHNAHIPVMNVSSTNTALLQDSTSTFVINDPNANVISFPIGVAKNKGAKKLSVIVVDLPIATDIYKSASATFRQNGLSLELVPVPLVTPDMTPQAQRIESTNSNGVVIIVGDDQFCIPALKGLEAVGFQGTITMISECLTQATRKAVPGTTLKGIQISSIAPVGEVTDASMRQYQAVLNTYATGENIDPTDLVGISIFQSLGGLSAGTRDLHGVVTPASVITALKAMPNEILPGSGNRLFRCNGKASPSSPSVCSSSVLAGTLDAQGNAVKYTVVNNAPIGN